MSDNNLRELYQQVILDHNKNPRNYKELPNATRKVDGYNPLCGDHYTVFVELDGDTIRDISFTGNGCAISKSSASVMTSSVKGKRIPTSCAASCSVARTTPASATASLLSALTERIRFMRSNEMTISPPSGYLPASKTR